MPIQVNDTTVIDDSRNVQNLANADASFVLYSNTTSGLTSTNLQDAVDEVDSICVKLSGDQTISGKYYR